MTAILTVQQARLDHWKRCEAEAKRLYKRAIRPVARRLSDGRPEVIGSSILVEVGGARCLATAAHVLDGHAQASLHVGAGAEFIPLNATFEATTMPDGQRRNDNVDVAIAPLSQGQVEAFGDAPFIRLEDQMRDVIVAPEQFYLVMGFRTSKNKVPRPGQKTLQLTMTSYKGYVTELPKLATRQHGGEFNFAVEYPKRVKQGGQIVKSTPPEGISGGAIFRLGSLNDPAQVGSPDPHLPRLAGITIECLKQERVLVGAKVEALRQARAASLARKS